MNCFFLSLYLLYSSLSDECGTKQATSTRCGDNDSSTVSTSSSPPLSSPSLNNSFNYTPHYNNNNNNNSSSSNSNAANSNYMYRKHFEQQQQQKNFSRFGHTYNSFNLGGFFGHHHHHNSNGNRAANFGPNRAAQYAASVMHLPMPMLVQSQTLCRLGASCKFKRENKCKYFHPSSSAMTAHTKVVTANSSNANVGSTSQAGKKTAPSSLAASKSIEIADYSLADNEVFEEATSSSQITTAQTTPAETVPPTPHSKVDSQ